MASSLRKNLTCDICSTVFTDPVILPCMHTFCKHCVTPLITSEISSDREVHLHEVDSLDGESDDVALDKGPVIQCPTCYCISTLEKGVDSLPLNITFDNITKKYRQNLKTTHRVLCDICKDSSEPVYATKSCAQCRLSYCDSCVENLHPDKGKLSQHTLCEPIPNIDGDESDTEQDLGAGGDFKRDHFGIGFCTECKVTFKIYDDSGTLHKEHPYIDCKLAKAAQMAGLEIMENQLLNMKEELGRRIKIAEGDIEGFELEEKRRISEVQKSMNGLRSLIDEKEHALVIQIKSETLQNVQDRSKYVQELQKVLSNVRHGIIDIRNILDEDFQNMTMESLLEIEDRANRCKALPDNLNHSKPESPKSHLDTKPIEELLATLNFRQTGIQQVPTQFVYQGQALIRQPHLQNFGYFGIPVSNPFPNQIPGQMINNFPNIQQFPVALPQPQQHLQHQTIPMMQPRVTQNVNKLEGAFDKMFLDSMPPHERKQRLGEKLFPIVQQLSPDLAGKITGMLLELNDLELLQLLQSKEKLHQRVRAAIDILQDHERRIQNLQSPNKENNQEKNDMNIQSPNKDNPRRQSPNTENVESLQSVGGLQNPNEESAQRPDSS